MQSISGYIGNLFNGRQKPRPGTPGRRDIVAGTDTEAWLKRPLMDSNKFYAEKNKRTMDQRAAAGKKAAERSRMSTEHLDKPFFTRKGGIGSNGTMP